MERLTDDGPLRVARLVAGPLENNVWLAACASTRQAVIIDAASEASRILDAVAGFDVQAVLTTHGHADHHAAAAEVCASLGVPVRIHPADAPMAGFESWDPIEPGETIRFGSASLQAIHTPGHTPGSICFLAGATLFSGDTLFPGGPGATADPRRFAEIMESLERRIFTLPDHTRVLPGHGAPTTVGQERPSVPEWWRRGY